MLSEILLPITHKNVFCFKTELNLTVSGPSLPPYETCLPYQNICITAQISHAENIQPMKLQAWPEHAKHANHLIIQYHNTFVKYITQPMISEAELNIRSNEWTHAN